MQKIGSNTFQKRQWMGALVPLFLVSPVMAQSAETPVKALPDLLVKDVPLEYRQFEKVEITGSSIVRKEQTQALPVQVFTREDIKRSGMSSLTDVLFSMPAMSMVVNSSLMGITIGGYSAASLRSLPGATLVLLNGKRLAPFGRQTVIGVDRPGVDINTIPLSSVERIEILSDGASSLYGSDAIAGVINIITRTEQKGIEITAEKFGTFQGGGAGHQMTLNAGVGRLDVDGYSIRLTAELMHRDGLHAQDRPQYSAGRFAVQRDGQTYWIDGSRVLSNSSPGTFYVPTNSVTGEQKKYYNSLYQDGQCPQGYLPMLNQRACQFNGYSTLSIYPQQDARRALLTGEKLLDGGVKIYTEMLYTEQADSQFEAQTWRALNYKIGKTPDAVGYQEAVNAGLNPANVQFLWMPSNLEGLKRSYEQRNWRLAAGVKGEWEQWDYHTNIYWTQANVARWLEVTDFVGQGLVTGKTLTDPNMLKALTSDNPLTAKLNDLRNKYNLWDKGRTDMKVGSFRASRSVMEIDGKDVMLGTGLEWRRESTDYQYVSNTENQPSFEAQRDVKAGYLELQIPVTNRWDVIGSVRQDAYSDIGKTTNMKLASRFNLDEAWAVRGSMGTGFRAPPLGQMQKLDKLYYVGLTQYNNDCSDKMIKVLANLRTSSGQVPVCKKELLNIYGNGNPNLKPEKSNQKSFGFNYRPSGNFSISADWWSISMSNMIGTLSDTVVHNDPLNYAQYIIMGAGDIVSISTPNYNIGRSEKMGVDFDVRWRKPTDWGQWNILIQGTYNIKSENQFVPGKPFVSDLGRLDIITDNITPRLRLRWMGGVTNQTWSLHGVLNYISGYNDTDRTGVNVATGQTEMLTGFRVPSFKTLDLNATYALNRTSTLRATVGNVLNASAPQSFTTTSGSVFGFNTRDHSLWGRTFSLAVTAKF